MRTQTKAYLLRQIITITKIWNYPPPPPPPTNPHPPEKNVLRNILRFPCIQGAKSKDYESKGKSNFLVLRIIS